MLRTEEVERRTDLFAKLYLKTVSEQTRVRQWHTGIPRTRLKSRPVNRHGSIDGNVIQQSNTKRDNPGTRQYSRQGQTESFLFV